MATVRAKFKVSSVKKIVGQGKEITAEEVELLPVYSSDPESENAKWSKATPSGNIRMYISNPGAFDVFEPGKEFFVDFTPAE